MPARPLAVAVLALALPGVARAGWVALDSPHFTVVSDASAKEARRVLTQFEQVRALLAEVWPFARLDPPRPITILAVRDESALASLLPSYWEEKGHVRPAGVFVGAPDRNWVALRMDIARFREADELWDNPYLVVFHEYVHLVLHLNFGVLPTWLDEGLAEFWGNTIVDDDRVYEGRHVVYHLLTLRQRAPMPVARLLAVSHGSPDYSEGNRATLFYAQSWALVHYLALGSDARRGQLNRYAALLKDGVDVERAASEAFGDLAALDRELASYLRNVGFRYRRRKAALQVAPEAWPARQLAPEESLALRAAFHVATGREADARRLAQEALALAAAAVEAHEALGLLAFRYNRRDDALRELSLASGSPRASDFAEYLYGRLLWETAADKEQLAAVEAALRRAVDKNDSFAAAYQALARVMAERGEPPEKTLPVAMRAVELEPGRVEHRIEALRLAAHGGSVEGARSLATQLLERVRGADRERVEAFLQQIADPRLLPPEAACDQGHAEACVELGARHRDGTERPRDLAKSSAYFERACAAGGGQACGVAGYALERGDGVPADVPRAVELFRKGCALDDSWSCTHLAMMLATGQGMAEDRAEAVRLLDASCRKQDVTACIAVGSLLRQGRGVARDLKRAEAALTGPCDQGSAAACAELGLVLALRPDAPSLARAAALFLQACEAGAAVACAMLASLHESGQGVARDTARARSLYARACAGGYAEACSRPTR